MVDTPPKYPFGETSPQVFRQQHRDLEGHASDLEVFEQVYQQVSAGRYLGLTKKVYLGQGCSIQLETFNQTLDQWGAVQPNTFCLIFLMNKSGHSKLLMQEFNPDCILVCTPGGDYDMRSVSGSIYCALSFPYEALAQFLDRETCAAFEARSANPSTTLLERPSVASTLRQIVRQILVAVSIGSREEREHILTGLRLSLAAISAGVISEASCRPGKPVQTSTREQLADAIRASMRTTVNYETTIDDIAGEFGVSQRTIEAAFQSTFGQSPAQYKRIILLNRFRSALLHRDNKHRSIGDIAAEFGIWHLSRLAQQYRQQFGELPSGRKRY